MLWSEKNVKVGIVSWMVFESFAYAIFTLLSSVLLLLLSTLFFWSILNRPSPPLSEFQISEAIENEASISLRIHVNKLLQVSHDIAMGRYSELTVPDYYERYEDYIDRSIVFM